jgi:hypothetical protein
MYSCSACAPQRGGAAQPYAAAARAAGGVPGGWQRRPGGRAQEVDRLTVAAGPLWRMAAVAGRGRGPHLARVGPVTGTDRLCSRIWRRGPAQGGAPHCVAHVSPVTGMDRLQPDSAVRLGAVGRSTLFGFGVSGANSCRR